MSIAKKIQAALSNSSWIRRMFEEGSRLKTLHGADKVFDFSLGNPNLEPPLAFENALREVIDSGEAGSHGYMPNAGYPHIRQAVAESISQEQAAPVTAGDVIMTCGAAGALNVILKAILDPGDEVITPAPYFVEYRAYADNHGGVLKTVPTLPDFNLDLRAMEAAVTEKTRAVLINSPNNPTGQVYAAETLKDLGNMLTEKSKILNRTLYLISDEPYRKIVYDGIQVPSIFNAYPESIVATSYSKDLSIPGERLGYAAVNPRSAGRSDLAAAMALTNRILGFVNAPALMQKVIGRLKAASVDVSQYAVKRKLLCEGLAGCGYQFTAPAGAFYLFPKSPIPDDVAFVRILQEELILAVPGTGFGGPGHFRLAFCVDDNTIINAMPGFKKAIQKAS
jgi:aspartate aminotransferase